MYEEIRQLKELEAKDPETYSHMLRVSGYSGLIAQHYSIPDMALISSAAKYHDIGKIAFDKSLLNSSFRLNEEQRRVIQRNHVLIGEHILRQDLVGNEIPKIVRHHHERYDGNGYPDRLARENIPLGSRIIAIADAYDAMFRPYNGSRDKDRSILLKEQKGKQFDPYLIDVVLELIGTQEWHGAVG